VAQTTGKHKRVGAVIDALKSHGIKEEELATIQTKIDPLLTDEGEVHIHIEGDDTHIHVDVHEAE
jgi:uncharacterized protein YggE